MFSRKEGKYIALLGAYERDNFGDILFLLITQRLLEPWVSVPLSIVSQNMKKEGAGSVYSLSAWLDCCGEYTPAAIVVAGGQVLHLPVERALYMDMPNDVAGKFLALDNHTKEKLSRGLCWRAGPKAYLPPEDLQERRSSGSFELLINSVGYGGKNVSDISVLEPTLTKASFISVRDASTKDLLDSSFGIDVKLAPDIVSLFPTVFSEEIEECAKKLLDSGSLPANPYLILQISSDYAKRINLEDLSLDLARVLIEYDLSLVLLPAGLATSHDSLEVLRDLRELIMQRVSKRASVTVLEETDALLKVSAISMADAVIGTSLHVRILAMSFAKPRVSLEGDKVVRYCETWEDGSQPTGVKVGRIFDAYTYAIQTPASKLKYEAESIVERARKGFSELREKLPKLNEADDGTLVSEIVDDIALRALHHECEIYRRELVEVSSSLASAKHELSRYESHATLKVYRKARRIAENFLGKKN